MSRPKPKEMDLTVGNPFWSLLKFAIPVILGNLFQLFYTLADSVIVGKTLGFSVFLESVKYIGPVKSTLLGCLEPASATSAGKENGELFTEEVIKNIIEEFSLSDEEAEKYMKMYW